MASKDADVKDEGGADNATSQESSNKNDQPMLLPPIQLKVMNMADITGFHPLGIARAIVNRFSRPSSIMRRDPPSSHKTMHVRLVTINISPSCEMVRWTLDLMELEDNNPYFYTEDCHPPAFHAFETVPLTVDTYSATPVLGFPDGSFRVEAVDILSLMRPSLYPKDLEEEIKKFEREVVIPLSVQVRCLIMYYLFDEEKKRYPKYARLVTKHSSQVEGILYEKMLDKGIDKVLKETLVWNEEIAKNCIKEITKIMEGVSQRLDRNGGEFLFGKAFTAADLTFSAAAYHVICPEQMHDLSLTKEDELPQEWWNVISPFQQTKAGQHCCNMYKKQRPLGEDGRVQIKTLNRDCNPFKESWLYVAGAIGAAAGTVGAVLWLRRRN